MEKKLTNFNYHFYKDIFNNNLKNSVLKNFPLSTKAKKIKLINKSKSCIFPILDINNENNKEKNFNFIKENKIKTIINKTPKKIKNNKDIFVTLNKSLSINDNVSDIKDKLINEENEFHRKNNNNKSYFDYQSICLGKETDRNKIDNLNSPLLKYFLYNLFQNNKRSIKLNKISHSIKKRPAKNFNIYKPNFFLMNKNNNIFNHKNDDNKKIKNIISPKSIKNKFNKKKKLNYEDNSSSENNQIDSSDIEKLLKIEGRTQNLKKNLKSNETNFSSFLKTNKSKILTLKEFNNAKLNNIRNIEINNYYENSTFYKKPNFYTRKPLIYKN